ncbi:MAG: hypothetical protein HY744_10015 [Deltaproteobacteria bacterium]|nr:hypothetical protein [Deltaproteobacteria bacterium]
MPAIAPSLRPAVAALALAAAIAVGALGCEGRPRAALPAPEPLGASTSEAHLGEIDLGRGAPEGDGGAWLGTHGGTSLAELVLQLRAARGSEHLRGLYVRLGMAQLGYARAREIGQGQTGGPRGRPEAGAEPPS